MEEYFSKFTQKGLPGGPNELKAFTEGFIVSSEGQWAYPGMNTLIPNADGRITMQGVNYPVLGIDDLGNEMMMQPGEEYQFPGDSVYKIPMKKGGLVKMPKLTKTNKKAYDKKFSRSIDATSRLFTESPLFAKPKSKKRKIFDPRSQYQDGGIMSQGEPTGGVISQEEINAANNAMMKARLAYAQMHGNPAAQRMVVAPDQPYVYTGEEYDRDWNMPVGTPAGATGTHYMASFGNYAVPFIQQGPNGLYFNELPSIRDREAIRFDNEEDAQYFGGHYKEVAPDKSYRRKIENGSPYITSLSPEDEEQFQRFYNTLPENLQSDDPSYDIRGYWDSEGRPEEFDYSQPKEDDGYYHAYSINQNTGEYLKNPWHPTFQHAIDEDRKIGYRPVVNVKGELIATENPSIADPEEQTFLRNTDAPANYTEAELTDEEIEEYRKGGWIVEEIEEYDNGGGVNFQTYEEQLRQLENSVKAGYKGGRWYPHDSVEKGRQTIGYGHKLSGKENYSKGLTTAQVLALQKKDLVKHTNIAKSAVDKKYGAGTFDRLPESRKVLLVDYAYNGVLNQFPKFMDATVKGDKAGMLKEYKRYTGSKPLTQRNEWTRSVIEGSSAGTKKTNTPKSLPAKTAPKKQPVKQSGPKPTFSSNETFSYDYRPDAVYRVADSGDWYINAGKDTHNEFIKLNDPTGKRTETLKKFAHINEVPLDIILERINNSGNYDLR